MRKFPQNSNAVSHYLLWMRWPLFFGMAGIILLTAGGLVFGQTPDSHSTPTYIPAPVSDSITNPYERQISPLPIIMGQDASAKIRLTGINNPACRGIPGKPVDMMLVYDISASAGIGTGSNWEATSILTQALLDHLGHPIYQTPTSTPESSRIGLISSRIGTFGVEPVLIQSLTEDFSLLRSQVAAISPGDDTNMAAGLQLAGEELAKIQTLSRTQAVVLMLHDNAGFLEMRTAVAQIQKQGIPVYLIINNLNIPPESRLTRRMAEELADSNRIFIDPTPEELYTLFLLATNGDQTAAAAAIQVVEELTPISDVQIFNVSGENGRIEGSRVIWNIDRLGSGDSIDLSYGFRLPGTGAVNVSGGVVWLDCNGYPHSTVTGDPIDITIEVEIIITPDTLTVEPEPPRPDDDLNTPIPGSERADPVNGDTAPEIDLPDIRLSINFSQWWLLSIPIFPLLLWIFSRWRQGRRTAQKLPLRQDRPPTPRSKPTVKRIKLPTGQEMTHGWIVESFKDRHGRSLTLRYQTSHDEQNRIQLTVQVADDKKVIGSARLCLHTVTNQDNRTGQEMRLVQANLQTWHLQDPQDHRLDVETRLLGKLELWAKDQQAVDFIIPASLIDDAELLPKQGYTKQGTEWFKSILD